MTTRVETPQEYTQRILGNLGSQEPLEVLRTTAGRLRAFVRETPAEVLCRAPGPGRWSAVQIIAHLADSEIVGSWRLRLILAHNGATLQPFDQDEWAEGLQYDQADPEESVELFDVTRRANLRLLDRVDPTRRAHFGMHAERGRESIEHLLRLYAGHDLNHLRQIERIIRQPA
jgi:hypothetical protein